MPPSIESPPGPPSMRKRPSTLSMSSPGPPSRTFSHGPSNTSSHPAPSSSSSAPLSPSTVISSEYVPATDAKSPWSPKRMSIVGDSSSKSTTNAQKTSLELTDEQPNPAVMAAPRSITR